MDEGKWMADSGASLDGDQDDTGNAKMKEEKLGRMMESREEGGTHGVQPLLGCIVLSTEVNDVVVHQTEQVYYPPTKIVKEKTGT